MSKKALGLFIVFLVLYFLLLSTAGAGIAILVLAIGLLGQAIFFSIRPEYQDRWMKFINPGLYNAYSQKGYDYIRKRYKINIIMFYILSIIMAFNGVMQLKNNAAQFRDIFNLKEYSIFAMIIIAMVILSNYICKFIIKKSKTASEELGWNILLGLVFTIIMIFVISIFIALQINSI